MAKFEFRNSGISVFNTLEYVFNWKKAIITIVHLSLAIEKLSLEKKSRIIVESVTPVLELSTQKSLCKSLSSTLGLLCWYSLAAKVRNEICIAVVASSEEIAMVISEPSFLWILILLSFTEFFSSKASNEIKVNHPGCLSSFKYPPKPIDTVKSQVQSSQVKSPSSNKKHYHIY